MSRKKASLIMAVLMIAGIISACSNTAQQPEQQDNNVQTSDASDSTVSEETETAATDPVSSEISSAQQSSEKATSSQTSANSQVSQTSVQTSGQQSKSDTSQTSGSGGQRTVSANTNNNNTQSQSNTNNNSSVSPQNSTSNNSGNNTNNTAVNQNSNTSGNTNNSSANTNTSKPSSAAAPPQQQSSSQTSHSSQTSQPVPEPAETPAVNNNSVGDINLFNSLFNLANRVTVQLTVSQEEMNKLQNDYNKYKRMNSKSPIYRKASLTITVNGQSFSMDEVGIRLKGNMSLSPVYDKNGNLNLSHYKLSFNETFDDTDYYGSDAKVWASKEQRKERKNRRFATLKKMDLKWNGMYDDTYIREIYASEMFRDNGVLSQNIGLTQLLFNGNNYGVMKIYEPVDEIFLEKRLPAQALGGDLYKCGWTMSPCNYVQRQVTYGVDDKDTGAKFNFNLKTNEKSSNHASLKNLLSVLNSNPNKSQFESVVDTGYLANFLAASYFAGDPDDIRNNYNNHYVYFRKDNGKAIFIPYDNDRTMGITYGYNPDGTGMTKPSPYSNMASGARQTQANPMINLGIVNSNGYIRNEYTNALKNIANSAVFNIDNFNAKYEQARANYESVVTPSVNFANQKQQFKFSLDGNFTSGDNRNMSFSVFAERILQTFHSEVK